MTRALPPISPRCARSRAPAPRRPWRDACCVSSYRPVLRAPSNLISSQPPAMLPRPSPRHNLGGDHMPGNHCCCATARAQCTCVAVSVARLLLFVVLSVTSRQSTPAAHPNLTPGVCRLTPSCLVHLLGRACASVSPSAAAAARVLPTTGMQRPTAGPALPRQGTQHPRACCLHPCTPKLLFSLPTPKPLVYFPTPKPGTTRHAPGQAQGRGAPILRAPRRATPTPSPPIPPPSACESPCQPPFSYPASTCLDALPVGCPPFTACDA